ncbi:MAG TPA: winged helix-turn-helix domain-containing protein [Candidatus Limnocylindrales bacterium]|nr:winged helix-turn-helix domain-containing protein [Candidatus Limnocylindrales bacterium]
MEGDFRLSEWLICPLLNTVQKDGKSVRLEHKFMQVLVCLASRPGEVVSKDELFRIAWADTFVTDDVLTRAISELRRILNDDAKNPRIIETVSRNGYRLIAPVQRIPEASSAAAREVKPGFLAGRRRKLLVAMVIALVAIAIAIAVTLVRKPATIQAKGPQPIAVLPLQNASAAKELDFLRLGLADDIATTLSFYPSLSIRPFAATTKYAGPEVDIQKAARDLRVADLITGHFLVAGDTVEVTLEAVDAADNRVLWRTTLHGATRDLTQVQEQIAARVQHGLIPALGQSTASNPSSNISHNPQAYEFYLQAMSHNDAPNSQDSPFSSENNTAIQLLQRAVALDPGYASAWAALGHFYYYEGGLGGGGEIARARARAALQRAVALDPNRIEAASDLINMESEEGDLNQAYDHIANLLHQRPDSGAVHLVHSYVLWYAGLLAEAEAECEKTRALDAGTQDLASCGNVFMALGKYDRAREYFHLVSGTEYEKSGQVEILLREGKEEEALKILKSLPATEAYGLLLVPCLEHAPPPNEGVEAQKMRSMVMAAPDPGIKYLLAAADAFCGHPAFAFAELRRAISQNYCAYPQMETDPLLTNLRAIPEFAEIRSLGIACQQHFLEHRKQVSSQ